MEEFYNRGINLQSLRDAQMRRDHPEEYEKMIAEREAEAKKANGPAAEQPGTVAGDQSAESSGTEAGEPAAEQQGTVAEENNEEKNGE